MAGAKKQYEGQQTLMVSIKQHVFYEGVQLERMFEPTQKDLL